MRSGFINENKLRVKDTSEESRINWLYTLKLVDENTCAILGVIAESSYTFCMLVEGLPFHLHLDHRQGLKNTSSLE